MFCLTIPIAISSRLAIFAEQPNNPDAVHVRMIFIMMNGHPQSQGLEILSPPLFDTNFT